MRPMRSTGGSFARSYGVPFARGKADGRNLNVRPKRVSGANPENVESIVQGALRFRLGNHGRVIHGALHRGAFRRADDLVGCRCGSGRKPRLRPPRFLQSSASRSRWRRRTGPVGPPAVPWSPKRPDVGDIVQHQTRDCQQAQVKGAGSGRHRCACALAGMSRE